MGPQGLLGPQFCVLYAVLGALVCGLRPAAAMAVNDEKRSASPVTATQCWQVEDYVVVQECSRCSSFQTKAMTECRPTGFVEKVTCATSRKDDFKRCRSAVMEAHIFWRFVGTMMCVAALFAVLVVCRQRVLDRKALEKVRKQLESI
ncbi:protein JTB [Indicator indicator]|uniref:protein JTB n=1 Tax=Indicator indicator TaxID=1002788 RepID=UPI0023DEB47A|nr:protein JTB [Indicator indicator]